MIVSLWVSAEMFLDFLEARQLERFRHVQHGVFGLEALLLDPFLDDRLVLHDFHARLEHVERHPGKPFGVQLAQLVLVIVMVRRTEDDAAHAALRDECVTALRRLHGRALGQVERGEMSFQDVCDGLVLAQPRRFVERANKQRLRDRRSGTGILPVSCFGSRRRGRRRHYFLHVQLDGITLRLLQNEPRNVEQRIGAAGHLDLARERLDAVFVGQKSDGDFRQRRGRLGAFRRFTTIVTTPAKSAFAVAELGAAARRAASATTFATAAKTAAFAARAAAFAGFAAEAAFGLHALVAGEFFKAVGLGFPLRPRRLKQLFKVKSEIGNSVHVKSIAPSCGAENES